MIAKETAPGAGLAQGEVQPARIKKSTMRRLAGCGAVFLVLMSASASRAFLPPPPPPPPPPVSAPAGSAAASGAIGVGIFIGVVGTLVLYDFLSTVAGHKPWVDPAIGEPYLRRN